MSNKVRITIDVTSEVAKLLTELANEAGTNRAEILRRGLAIVKTARDQKNAGRSHLGFTSDAAKLDTELMGVI
jgi:Ribbon-helix-helix protein, copG family